MDKFIEQLSELKILYADDEIGLLEEVQENLAFFFKEVFVANDGEEALQIFKEERVDLVMLDILMPKMDGLRVAREIRKRDKHIPIVIVSAHSEKKHLMESIRVKIDDYIIKPANLDSVLSVFKRVLFRNDEENIELFSGCTFNIKSREIEHNDTTIKLGQKEEKLLLLLLKQPGVVISKKDVCTQIWGESEINEATYRSLVRNLRAKVGEESLETLAGVGLKIILS